jgi:hypothetical protein
MAYFQTKNSNSNGLELEDVGIIYDHLVLFTANVAVRKIWQKIWQNIWQKMG